MGKRIEYEQHSFDLPGLARPPRRVSTANEVEALHRALEPFISLDTLRRCIAEKRDVYEALRVDKPPRELRAMLDAVAAMLRPIGGERIRCPGDIAAVLMVSMGNLDQEELRTVLLDTKNRVQDITTVYRGSLNTALVRIGEVFKEAIRRNSASIIVAHNHPSSVVDPSPEDILLTRQIVEAGELLEVTCLDHLIIGRDDWLSLREKRLGFK